MGLGNSMFNQIRRNARRLQLVFFAFIVVLVRPSECQGWKGRTKERPRPTKEQREAAKRAFALLPGDHWMIDAIRGLVDSGTLSNRASLKVPNRYQIAVRACSAIDRLSSRSAERSVNLSDFALVLVLLDELRPELEMLNLKPHVADFGLRIAIAKLLIPYHSICSPVEMTAARFPAELSGSFGCSFVARLPKPPIKVTKLALPTVINVR